MKTIDLTNSPLKAMVDDKDFENLNCYVWRISGYGYAVTGNPRRGNQTFMHSIVLQTNLIPDHKDRNGLNNQRSNLRPATRSQNAANSKLRTDNKTGYRGVTVFKRDGNFMASIRFNGVTKNLGYYDTSKEAAAAYNKKAAELFGEFATINIL